MENKKGRIFVAEDDKVDQMAFKRFATTENFPYDYTMASSVKEAKEILNAETFAAVVTDYFLTDGTAFDILEEVKDIPVVIVTGTGDEEIAVKIMKAGAYDYLIKDPEGNYLKMLPVTVDNAIQHKRDERELRKHREHLEQLVKERTGELTKTLAQLQLESDERKRAIDALARSESNYRAIFNSANDAIFVIDTETGRVLDVNQRTCELLGYTVDEMKERNVNAMDSGISPYTGEDAQKWLRKAAQGEPQLVEWLAKDKEGRTFWVEVNLKLAVIGGTECLLAIVRDINERKQIEEEKEKVESQLRLAQRMEAIGTLAGGIAHDFNNILSAILGYTEMALFDAPEESSMKKQLDQVLKAGNRAKDLVKQILTFSRQTEQERKPIRIALVIQEVIKMLRASLPTTVEIRQNIKTDSDMVLADPSQVHQVVMNLCTNSAQAMRGGEGVLTVSLAAIVLDSTIQGNYPDLHPGPYLRLTVSDTGQGIESALLKRIFDPFFTTKERGKGTGLGLSVVHGIVKSYGGAVTVESEVGKGTTFQVLLPRIESETTVEEEVLTPLPGGSERILFVDDEESLVQVGQQMLERLGYEVITRTGGYEALEEFSAQPERFDLIITDQTMPHMSGEKLARKFLSIRKDIPIILCTGFSETMTSEKARAMGIKKLLMKPVVIRDLASTVRKVLDGK